MIPDEDLRAIDAALASHWPKLDGARLFFTGATGFIGRWMLEALARAPIDVDVTVLTRDPVAFERRAPHLAWRYELIAGDVLDLPALPGGYSHVIHGATDASAALTADDPRRMFDTIVTGTRAVLEVAHAANARFLLMSSGAVYGPQPWSQERVGEDWMGGPDSRDPRSAYAEGKRAAEALTAIYHHQFGLSTTVTRIFALLGPGLSLDTHFAAGNFIRDAIAKREIVVNGSGQAVRSYLYAADLAVWMWRLLLDAPPGRAYNVGSEEGVSIANLARRTAALLGAPDVEIRGRPDAGWNLGRYVPATDAIRRDLGVAASVGLDDAIRRTAAANGWTS
ncbi:dTDP-glucose 4,6-dehydratase [Sphingomonas guangdongensis]|uniref:dTDP-glucose 4,6-dehydratase n=1 Tax=Sphingomonas guangdongensis TaxID=1141890 RepID=A0A285QBI5_9SPHN|nr:NAD-dependent epimerase/dehydratase family protein [Sphingomonas guangdongensis]SOB79171.1 dTDP-glucose 4,6-dehydratase [Sphingomonas guangdongensis]